jgi:ATP-dependent helicase YprA (DUF1998 family)
MGSLWQQAGRGGRGTRASVALFIALDSPLDQALVANPASLLRREVEAAILDPHNPHILRGHLAAAAHELPLVRQAFPSWMRSILTEIYLCRTCSCQYILRMAAPGQDPDPTSLDVALFGKLALTDTVHLMMEDGDLLEREGGRLAYWRKASPAPGTSIRNLDDCSYKVVDISRSSGNDECVLETVEYAMAMLKLYEGAVYMHQGHTYVVSRFDIDNKVAAVQRNDVNYYTEPRDHSRVLILGRSAARELSTPFVRASSTAGASSQSRHGTANDDDSKAAAAQEGSGVKAQRAPGECVVVVHGRARVEKKLYGYRKKRVADSSLIEMVDAHMPVLKFDTLALWLTVPDIVRDEISSAGWMVERGAMHTVEHLLVRRWPLRPSWRPFG